MATIQGTPPDPGTYTRSVKALLLNRAILVLAFVGLFISGVLSMEHLFNIPVPCGGSGGCAQVSASPASKLFGVPVAYFGFLAYVGIAGLAMVRSLRDMRSSKGLVTAGYTLAVVGTVFSLYLQYQAYFVIRAFCPWCFASAVTIVILLILHAMLANAVEEPAAEARSSAVDTIMPFALPVILVLALGMQGFNMQAEARNPDPSGAISGKLPQEALSLLLPEGEELNAIGPDDAKITIVEFADIDCRACKESSPTVKAFAEEFPTQVRFVYRHFPLDHIHPYAAASAAVSEYAAEKGKFWEYLIAAMAVPEVVQDITQVLAVADKVGLDVDDVQKRMSDPKDAAFGRVQRDLEASDKLGIMQTPTFFIIDDKGNIEIATSRNIKSRLAELSQNF
jgi:uncharacterized membrane protein/protein-disulfide isomerase